MSGVLTVGFKRWPTANSWFCTSSGSAQLLWQAVLVLLQLFFVNCPRLDREPDLLPHFPLLCGDILGNTQASAPILSEFQEICHLETYFSGSSLYLAGNDKAWGEPTMKQLFKQSLLSRPVNLSSSLTWVVYGVFPFNFVDIKFS